MGLARTRLGSAVYSVYEARLRASLVGRPRPRHVAVMLDGNRRWARAAGFDVSHGHREGARKIADLLQWCSDVGIDHVTLFLLSTDNFVSRDDRELAQLLDIITDVVDNLAGPETPWRVIPVGALDLLPPDMSSVLKAAAERTADRTGLTVNVAVGYGGRQEIADAVRSLLQARAAEGQTLEQVAEDLETEHIAEHLYTKGQPDPDLVIRTSGEQRLSGFLLWQSAHSEFHFTDALWPDFRKIDFLRALRDYAARSRRFGA